MGDIQLRNITTQSELTPLCSIAAESWLVDPLFNWVVPGLHEYPDDFLTLWKYILKTEFRSTGRHIIVAESPGANGYAAVGFAVWERSSAPTNMEERFSVRTFKNSMQIFLSYYLAMLTKMTRNSTSRSQILDCLPIHSPHLPQDFFTVKTPKFDWRTREGPWSTAHRKVAFTISWCFTSLPETGCRQRTFAMGHRQGWPGTYSNLSWSDFVWAASIWVIWVCPYRLDDLGWWQN